MSKHTTQEAGTASDHEESSPKPSIPPVNSEAIPAVLKALQRWLNWRYEWKQGREGKPGGWTKVPVIAGTDQRTDATKADHLAPFDAALVGARRDGYGLGFALGDGIAGVDLDDCRDLDTGALAPWGALVVTALASYTEVSPSGTGVKIFVRGSLPEPGKGIKKADIEVYDRRRFFTVTGQHLTGTPTTVEEA